MKMVFAGVLVVSMAIVWAGGCQEEQLSSGDKAARLEAAENRDLQSQFQAEMKKKDDEIKKLNEQLKNVQAEIVKKDDEIKKLSEREQEQLKKDQASAHVEITKRDDEIENLGVQFQAEMKKRDDEIQDLQKRLGQCSMNVEEKIREGIEASCKDQVSSLSEWVAELQAENERLKAGHGSTDK